MYKNNTRFILLYILALLGVIIAGMAVRLTDLGPFNLGFYRLFIGTLILIPFGIKYRHEYSMKTFLIASLSGVFFALSVVFWHIAIVTTSISSAGLILNMWVFISILLFAIFFKEKITKYAFLGMGVAIFGLIIMVSGQKSSESSTVFGNVMAFGTAATYALYVLTTYTINKGRNPFGLLFISSLAGSVVLFVFSYFTEGIQIPNDTGDYTAILIIAVVAQVGALGITNIVLNKLPVITFSLLSLLQPIMSSGLGFLVFGEKLSFLEILGILIVICGIFVNDLEKITSKDNKKKIA